MGMVISLLGPSGIRCQVADFSLLVDPPTKKKGGLTLYTETKIQSEALSGEGEIDGPGEFEISGVKVRGVSLKSNDKNRLKTAYVARLDGMRLGFLNGLSNPITQEDLDKLGEIDVLFIDPEISPLSIKDIATLIKKVEPDIVIPLTDKGVKKLSEELGQKVKAEEKLVLKAKDLEKEEGVKIIWLKRI